MSQRIRQGWSVTKRHFKIILLYFFYQMLWGFFLYRIVDHIVSPLLLRYPKITNQSEAIQLFWIENQFNLLKTDMITPYLWSALGLLLLRMLLTPILQSGLNYSLYAMSQGEQHTQFRKGIASCWKPMTLMYWLKNLAIIAPLAYLLRPLFTAHNHQAAITAVLEQSGWLWLAALLWAITISALFYIMSLGIGAQLSPLNALMKGAKHILQVLAIGIVLALIYGLISLSIHSLSILWVTFISFLLYQLLPLVRAIFKIWTISSQYTAIGNDLHPSNQ